MPVLPTVMLAMMDTSEPILGGLGSTVMSTIFPWSPFCAEKNNNTTTQQLYSYIADYITETSTNLLQSDHMEFSSTE